VDFIASFLQIHYWIALLKFSKQILISVYIRRGLVSIAWWYRLRFERCVVGQSNLSNYYHFARRITKLCSFDHVVCFWLYMDPKFIELLSFCKANCLLSIMLQHYNLQDPKFHAKFIRNCKHIANAKCMFRRVNPT
jgi:hypothetical protein